MAKAAASHRKVPDKGRHLDIYSVFIIRRADQGASDDSLPKSPIPEPTMTGCGGIG
jgi:hypothetical protein